MVKQQVAPCTKCGWRYPGFHICLDLPKSVMKKVEDGKDRDSNGRIITGPKPRPSRAKNQHLTHREAISAGIKAKHANDPKRIERDKEIVRLYGVETMSIREVSAKMDLSQKTVMSALHRARDRGEVIIRPPARRKAA